VATRWQWHAWVQPTWLRLPAVVLVVLLQPSAAAAAAALRQVAALLVQAAASAAQPNPMAPQVLLATKTPTVRCTTVKVKGPASHPGHTTHPLLLGAPVCIVVIVITHLNILFSALSLLSLLSLYNHCCPADDASSCSSGLGERGGGAAAAACWERLGWEVVVHKGSATAAHVQHLRPASRYALRVRAYNGIGASGWGDVLTAVTLPAAPAAPGSLAVMPLSSSSVQLSWTAPLEDNGAPVSSYTLEMAGPGAAPGWTKVWQGSGAGGTCCTTVDGLLPGRSYTWRLRATHARGSGPWGQPTKARTLPAPPGAPQRPTVSQRTATSAKARWGLPQEDNGATPGTFLLQLRTVSLGVVQQQQEEQQQQQQQLPPQGTKDQGWEVAYDGPEMTHRVNRLLPGQRYELRVAAVNSAGAGPWSEPAIVETLLRAPQPPQLLVAELEEQQSHPAQPALSATWAAPPPAPATAEVVVYEVEAVPQHSAPAGTGALKCSTPWRSKQASLGGLTPGTIYLVRVRAVGADGAGHSPWSEAATVVVPGAPEHTPCGSNTANGGGAVLGPAASSDGSAAGAPLRRSRTRNKTAAATKGVAPQDGATGSRGGGIGSNSSSSSADRLASRAALPAARHPTKPPGSLTVVWRQLPRGFRQALLLSRRTRSILGALALTCLPLVLMVLSFLRDRQAAGQALGQRGAAHDSS
jgi:Fibronectin type III domain